MSVDTGKTSLVCHAPSVIGVPRLKPFMGYSHIFKSSKRTSTLFKTPRKMGSPERIPSSDVNPKRVISV